MSSIPPPPGSYGAPDPSPYSMPPPGTPSSTPFLVWSIIVTVVSLLGFCFCFPLIATIPGIVAIVYAAQIGSKAKLGDYAGASNAARTAKIWCIVATALLVLAFVAYMIMFAVMGGAEGMQEILNQYQNEMGV